MDHAAQTVMQSMQDVVLAFGESDEYRCGRRHSLRQIHFALIVYSCGLS